MSNRDQREEPIPRLVVTPSLSPPSVLEERRMTAWIGKAVTITGDVVASEDLIVDGQVEGRIDLRNHHLTVGVGARLRSDVRARIVTVRGAVIGNITASERLEILETGSVEGDVRAPRFMMKDGAQLRGIVNADSGVQLGGERGAPRSEAPI